MDTECPSIDMAREDFSAATADAMAGQQDDHPPATPFPMPRKRDRTHLSSGLSTMIGHSPTDVDTSSAASSESGASSGRSSRSSRSQLIPPSPSRSRLDPQYAARLLLNSTSSQWNNSTLYSILPPPGISRNRTSMFRAAVVPGDDVTMTSGSESQDWTPDRRDPCSSSFSTPTSSIGYYGDFKSPGSFGSLNSPTRTPRRYSTKYGKRFNNSDRFIPSRATSNLNFSLWSNSSSNSSERSNRGASESDDSASGERGDTDASDGANTSARTNDSTSQTQQPLLNILLRSELLGENLDPLSSSPASYTGDASQRRNNTAVPLREGGNLRFQSPREAYLSSSLHSMTGPTAVVSSFSLTPVGNASSHRLLSTPQKLKRRIPKVPFKVLDAPALQDDFYLNLVDWSSQNVLAVGLGSCVYLWSACTSKVTKLCDLAQSEDIVTSVSWAQRGTHLAVGTNRGEVQLWDTTKCKKVRTMGGHSARIGTLSFSGPTLASGSRDRLIYLRDVRIQPQFTARLASHKQEVCGLKWSFDEPSNLASGGNDNKLFVWDVKNTSVPVHRFAEHTAAVKAIAWSPHQHGLLVSGGGTADRCIRFWNTLSGAGLSCVDTGSQVCNLAWSQNCNELVSTHGYSLNQIVVWRYPSMSKVATLTGHTYRVLYLAMSPDGSTIVTGAGDETLRFWQVFPGPRSNDKSTGHGLLFPAMPGSVVR